MKILVTEGTSAFAQRVSKLLVNVGLCQPEEIFYAASDALPEVLEHGGKYHRIPDSNDQAFSHALLKKALDLGVNAVLPLELGQCLALAEAQVLFEEFQIRNICPTRHRLRELSYVLSPPSAFPLRVSLPGHNSELGSFGGDAGIFTYNDEGEVYYCLATQIQS